MYITDDPGERTVAAHGADGKFEVDLPQGSWTFTTRLSQASRVIEIRGDRQEVELGAPPGSCGLVLRLSAPALAATLVPGAQPKATSRRR